jgi:hypothetical protein
MFAIAFYIAARSVSPKSIVRDYVLIAAFGIVPFLFIRSDNYYGRILSTVWACVNYVTWVNVIFIIHWTLFISIFCFRRYIFA